MNNSENCSIPVLTYHSIDDSGSVVSVSPHKFKEQMDYLKKKGYRTISPDEIVESIEKKRGLTDKTILITFDDGYKNNYTDAFPILRENGFTAIVFLTTEHCERNNDWDGQHPSIPVLPMLSWDEIREMDQYGIEFGAHTQTHCRLAEVNIDRARSELTGSKKEIEEKLGKPVSFFAYPFGSFNEEVREAVSCYFKGAISTMPGKVNYKSDVFALERVNAAGKIFKVLPFEILFMGSMNVYLILKKTINALNTLRKK